MKEDVAKDDSWDLSEIAADKSELGLLMIRMSATDWEA